MQASTGDVAVLQSGSQEDVRPTPLTAGPQYRFCSNAAIFGSCCEKKHDMFSSVILGAKQKENDDPAAAVNSKTSIGVDSDEDSLTEDMDDDEEEELLDESHSESSLPDEDRELSAAALLLIKMAKSSSMSSSMKRKRQRTNPEQLDLLEQMFHTTTTPNQQMRAHLAAELGMSARRIQIWFQNKRAKVKRAQAKHEQFIQDSQQRTSSSSPLSSLESTGFSAPSAVPNTLTCQEVLAGPTCEKLLLSPVTLPALRRSQGSRSPVAPGSPEDCLSPCGSPPSTPSTPTNPRRQALTSVMLDSLNGSLFV